MNKKLCTVCCSIFFTFSLSGCMADSMDTRKNNIHTVLTGTMIPTKVPTPINTIEIYDTVQGKRVEVDVLSLTSDQIRSRLTSTSTFVSMEKLNTDGTFNYIGSSGKVQKGRYRVTFDYTNFTTQPIKTNDGNIENSLVIGKIGVGLRITADLITKSNGVRIDGLIPLAVALQNNKVSGNLSFNVYGVSNKKVDLAVPTQAILSEESIQKAFESAAAVRIIFGLEETKLEPYLIGVAGINPRSANTAVNDAKVQLIK